ncbi:hypothetical protein [Streptomyces sp. KMM 9044]|uniref:hypothetical protein n=1 Tax=Streptomyces sp. KMM 9044 TaxID=2744474 RepID=UPI002151F1A5|nr:hypothetical protein [Streptomyces sp. KMM 9044]WAX79272.1 hypothetical protein HUV60_018000 [Streptomyces sp. KMM 9044]
MTLVQSLKEEREVTAGRPSAIEVALGDGNTVRIRAAAAPGTAVTTDRRRWDTFVRGVRAGEFDHFSVRT